VVHVARMGEECTGFWWENPEERELGRPRRRWEDGIRMDFGVIGWGGGAVDSVGSG
jgi:hypothetical protein